MDGGTVGADELSARLWRERRQLDYLLYLLETQLLHLQAGNWHRLNHTAAELEKVIDNLRFDSLARGLEASAMVSQWDESEHQALPAVVAATPSSLWQGLLKEHREAMASLLAGIDEAAAANTSLLLQGVDIAGDSMARISGTATDDLAHIVHETNVQRALAAVASASLPAVRDFLGY